MRRSRRPKESPVLRAIRAGLIVGVENGDKLDEVRFILRGRLVSPRKTAVLVAEVRG